MNSVLERLEVGENLSDEQRKYLIWGLRRELDENEKDPFNLTTGKLTGKNLYGSLTKSEQDWAAYASVLSFMEKGNTLSEASYLAAKALAEAENIHLEAGTVENKYKSVRREFRCAELVFESIVDLGLNSDVGKDLEAAVNKASQKLEESGEFSVTRQQIQDHYQLHKHVLIEQLDLYDDSE